MNWPSLTYVAPSRSHSLRSSAGGLGRSPCSHSCPVVATASNALKPRATPAGPARSAMPVISLISSITSCACFDTSAKSNPSAAAAHAQPAGLYYQADGAFVCSLGDRDVEL